MKTDYDYVVTELIEPGDEITLESRLILHKRRFLPKRFWRKTISLTAHKTRHGEKVHLVSGYYMQTLDSINISIRPEDML